MKKLSLILVLVLGLALIGFAENHKELDTIQKDGFKIKPKLFWSTITPFILRSDRLIGVTVFGLDGSLLKCKDFHFLAVGGGLQTYYTKTIGWHMYRDSRGYQRQYYGEGYEFKFEFYLKFVPIKWRWNWASKVLKINSYLELGITNKKEIIFGLTFSGRSFKKRRRR